MQNRGEEEARKRVRKRVRRRVRKRRSTKEKTEPQPGGEEKINFLMIVLKGNGRKINEIDE